MAVRLNFHQERSNAAGAAMRPLFKHFPSVLDLASESTTRVLHSHYLNNWASAVIGSSAPVQIKLSQRCQLATKL